MHAWQHALAPWHTQHCWQAWQARCQLAAPHSLAIWRSDWPSFGCTPWSFSSATRLRAAGDGRSRLQRQCGGGGRRACGAPLLPKRRRQGARRWRILTQAWHRPAAIQRTASGTAGSLQSVRRTGWSQLAQPCLCTPLPVPQLQVWCPTGSSCMRLQARPPALPKQRREGSCERVLTRLLGHAAHSIWTSCKDEWEAG